MKMKESLTVRKSSGTTGRGGSAVVDNHQTAYYKVTSFVKELCSTERTRHWGWLLLTNSIAKSIYREAKQAMSVGIHGRYFRGRRFPKGQEPKSASDFGPPPPEKRGKGRYNEYGKKVLYMCRNLKTVVAECPYSSENPCLYIQAFDIQLETARILKLDTDLEQRFPYLNYLLLESEYAAEGTDFAKFPYRATHFLAEVCRRLGINAVEYPSVRGRYKDNPDAVNLVLFEPYCDSVCNMTVGEPLKYECDQLFLGD